jgi:hypothetical protein
VLYEIIAGRGPFDDEGDGHKIAAAHMTKFPLPASHFAPVPRELDILLMAALAKNPDARPRDAFSFAASLRNLKRRLEETRPHESTENRVTAGAVLGPESTPGLAAGPSTTPDGSPPPATGTASTAAFNAKTTLMGMPNPTVAPSLAKTSPNVFATTHDVRDRVATTNRFGTDTLPMPQHSTEALPPRWQPPAPPEEEEGPGQGAGEPDIHWPPEREPILSDEPQVRSLPVSGSPRRTFWPVALAGAAAVIATVIAIRVAPFRSSSWTQPPLDTRAAMVAPGAAPVPLAKVETLIPAPTIAPPAFEDPTVAPRASAAKALPAPAPSGAPATSTNAPTSAPSGHSPVRKGDPVPPVNKRPGAGF